MLVVCAGHVSSSVRPVRHRWVHRRTFLRSEPLRPSICGTSKLCRWVVTHSFRVADLHGHRPDVFIHSHPLW